MKTNQKAKLAVMKAAFGIVALPEEELLKRLEALWFAGYAEATDTLQPVLGEMSQELMKIVYAYMGEDAAQLHDVVAKFAAKHVRVIDLGSKSVATH